MKFYQVSLVMKSKASSSLADEAENYASFLDIGKAISGRRAGYSASSFNARICALGCRAGNPASLLTFFVPDENDSLKPGFPGLPDTF